jgi:hypothetical protein
VVVTWPTAFLVLLDAVMAVLVVYLARLFVSEDFIGFGYCDKFLLGG